MQFDLFHSVARIDSVEPKVNCREVYENLVDQVVLAEDLGFDTCWLAESHFSSELQKKNSQPVIPNFIGEVGLNNDSFQVISFLCERTRHLNFGTAILNIVGGNGGPIAAADRVNSLAFLNQLRDRPRHFFIGFAAGRFPYINAPFGIVPRTPWEEQNWEPCKRHLFLEAAEIFLRLLKGEALASDDTRSWLDGDYQKRWNFERLKLVPEISDHSRKYLHFVLGSHDPLARDLCFDIADVDMFNLSFTPPDQLDKVHEELTLRCASRSNLQPWSRARMPRTVLVFIDKDSKKAHEHASRCFDTYIEAMRGTAILPPKGFLTERALVGDPTEIFEQLTICQKRRFNKDDRLMLWFEFNQNDNQVIKQQMRLFSEQVISRLQ